LTVKQKDLYAKKYGDFTDIYYGETITEESAASIPVCLAEF
jgi:hypothetical protein